uniref:Uncharacterized protein n=1 Tax=Anguilla anguilla TaxID=7936 RepID=A0A0E9TR88_ANGAN
MYSEWIILWHFINIYMHNFSCINCVHKVLSRCWCLIAIIIAECIHWPNILENWALYVIQFF